MRNIVILQARLNSKRLPNKVLLNINKFSLIELAYKRVASKKFNTLVVIPEEGKDDLLIKKLTSLKIPFKTGSEKNVLKRFICATKQNDDNDNIVRLTSDNFFPDSFLIENMLRDFNQNSYNYLTTTDVKSGLPYGCSVEITKLKFLREAFRKTKNPYDLEHVTEYIRNNYCINIYRKFSDFDAYKFRCTIDTHADYVKIKNFCKNLSNLDSLRFDKLICKLIDFEKQNRSYLKRKFVLGTVQLGLNYGINNEVGKPTDKESKKILDFALNKGVVNFDTANSYGNSEKILGKTFKNVECNNLKIISKFKIFINKKFSKINENLYDSLHKQILISLTNLKIKKLYAYLFHNLPNKKNIFEEYLSVLIKIKSLGLIQNIGVSVQSINELKFVLNYEDITYIQMPYNILDRRWDKLIDTIKILKKKRKIIIACRSVFLQGLLLSKNSRKWRKCNVKDCDEIFYFLKKMKQKFKCLNIAELSIKYINSIDWIDQIVLGSDTLDQLKSNLSYFSSHKLSKYDINKIDELKPVLSDEVLNPSFWKEN